MTRQTYSIPCYLVNRYGKIVDTHDEDVLQYVEVRQNEKSDKVVSLPSGALVLERTVQLQIKGYIMYCEYGQEESSIMPFTIRKKIQVYEQMGNVTKYKTKDVCLKAYSHQNDYDKQTIVICIQIDTIAIAAEEYEFRVTDEFCCRSRTKKAVIYQYNAIGDGEKRIFTNADEIEDYGELGILSPWDVSYYNVFVNGMLLPYTDYAITKGKLEFKTIDRPLPGQIINVIFVIIRSEKGYLLRGKVSHYCTLSDGIKRNYSDADEYIEYGICGIPHTYQCSLINLYINGCIQPKTNYSVSYNHLSITTEDIPLKGNVIILEYIQLYGLEGQLISMQEEQFNTISDGSYLLKSADRLQEYNSTPIPDPNRCSYQYLFNNGIVQPKTNYYGRMDCIRYRTVTPPMVGTTITLQSITMIESSLCRRK